MKGPIPVLFGPYGRVEPTLLAGATDCGVNAAWFHGFSDQMFEACREAGLSACVEFKTFRADFQAHPELIPTGIDGKPIRFGRLVQGVCLSRRDYLDATEADLEKGLAAYKPAGVWLDYLTYSGWFETPKPDLQESCFCPACITDFCEATGIDAETPSRILETHLPAWTQRKCQRVADQAARYSAIIRKADPSCVIGAYMCPYLPKELDGALTRIFAQDYELMADSIDVFTPLIYVEKSGRTSKWGREFLEASPGFVPEGHPVQLILDMLDFPSSLEEAAASAVSSHGLQLFGGRGMLETAEGRGIFGESVAAIRRKLEQI